MFALRGVSLSHLGFLFGHVGGGFLYLVVSTLGAVGVRHGTTRQAVPSRRPLIASAGTAFLLTAFLMRAFDAAVNMKPTSLFFVPQSRVLPRLGYWDKRED